MTQHATTYRQVTYRLLPQTADNWRWLERTLESQRLLYNAALEERIDCYRKTGRAITYFDQCKGLTECRKALPEMAAVSVHIQRGALKRLDEAYKGFFRRKGGFPRFRGRRHWNSIGIVSNVKVDSNGLFVPCFRWLAIRRRGGNPYADGKPVSAVLKRECSKWYAVVCFAVELAERDGDGTAIGLDLNAGQVAASDRRIFEVPDMSRLEARKRRYQRKMSRQRKASRRRERTRLRLRRTQRRIAMRRRNWQHHVSRRIADSAYTVVIEDLSTQGMTRSAKGTADAPGRNVKAKAGLNRGILNTGWSDLRRMLDYKAGAVIAVDPAYTSQTCAECGVVDARSRKTRDSFECVACGHADHADLNAAANILASGIGATVRGGGGIARPVNREITAKAA